MPSTSISTSLSRRGTREAGWGRVGTRQGNCPPPTGDVAWLGSGDAGRSTARHRRQPA